MNSWNREKNLLRQQIENCSKECEGENVEQEMPTVLFRIVNLLFVIQRWWIHGALHSLSPAEHCSTRVKLICMKIKNPSGNQ